MYRPCRMFNENRQHRGGAFPGVPILPFQTRYDKNSNYFRTAEVNLMPVLGDMCKDRSHIHRCTAFQG